MKPFNMPKNLMILVVLALFSLPFIAILTRYEGLVNLTFGFGPGSGQVTIDGRSLPDRDTPPTRSIDENLVNQPLPD